jgi:aminopeptidase
MLGAEYCLATKERAEMLGLNLKQWRSVMLDGCLANQKEISERVGRLSEIMRTGREVSVETQHGTNLKFRLVGRKPSMGDSIVSDEDAAEGIVKFIPSGFVETAPDEESAEGVVVYDCPVLVRGGKRIEGLTLKFRNGKIVSYSALSGLEAFTKYLESGTGGIDRIGFFGLGLNPGLKHGFTQDDKVLGGVTIGIGGNEDKGGKNRTSGNNHWWASMTQATVHIDEIPVLVRGNYTSK